MNPYAAPVSSSATVAVDVEARASRMAGAIVAGVALVRIACWAVIVYQGATGFNVLGELPPGVTATVMHEVLAFPLFAPLALLYGILAIPLLRGSRRFRRLTLGFQILYAVVPLMGLRRVFARSNSSSLVRLQSENVILALLPVGIVLLLLFGRPTRGRLHFAWAGIVLLVLVWTARLMAIGLS